MKINGLLRLFKGVNRFRGDRPTERQWQPTNTAHDPNPPITLESGGGGSPVNYALTCAIGSYAIAGQAATLTVGRRMALDAGAYAVAGQAATLKVARRLTLDAGAYAITGQAATLIVSRRLTLDPGSYAVTGQAATLDYVPGASAVNYVLDLAPGAYNYLGNAATLTVARNFALEPGSYIYTGKAATLDYVQGGNQTDTGVGKSKQQTIRLRDLGDVERQSTAEIIKAKLAKNRQKIAQTDDVNLTVNLSKKGAKNAKSNLWSRKEKTGTDENADQKRQEEINVIIALIASGNL